MTRLYHFWSSPTSQRIRLALAYKQISYQDIPLSYWDDETFFELGVQRSVPVLVTEQHTLTDSLEILHNIDHLFPDSPTLVSGIIDEAAWQATLAWRESVESILQRLYAPILLAYDDIGKDENAIADYKNSVQRRFGLSVENLANDRYDAFAELEKKSRLRELGKHLAKNRFYAGKLSIADLLITADLYPLQLLDGVNMPIDLLYYLRRVEEACNLNLRAGMLINID